MKSLLTITAVLILSYALNSTVAQAQKTSAGYDESVNFSTFKTFKFDKSGARNPFVNELIVAAVERELTSRGLTKVDSEPDLLVVYLAAVGMDLRVANVPFYHVVNPAYSGMVGSAAQQMWDVTSGTLVVDLVDAKAERLTTKGSIQQYQTTVTLTSIDKQKLGQVAAEMHKLRKPDAYKGKGVRYAGVPIKLKPGKTGK